MRMRRRTRARGGLTGRALVLGAVVVLMALVLASPMQRFLQQRQSVGQAAQRRAELIARVNALEAQKSRWNDPAYVEEQARARLQYARPGDTVYVVVDPGRSAINASAEQATPTSSASDERSWQSKAWTSLRVADGAP